MQKPPTCLSAELLRQLSQDELSPAELKDLEDHVSECERCRQLLEVPQSDPQWQDAIVPILRTPMDSPHVASDHDERCSERESLESILKLLGPTDDPHMLGRIGTYEVVGVIGRGGMGVVFKAYESALNRFVAIKMLLPHLAASGAARNRFAREGQAAAAVIDDNVMPIYSVAEWQGVPYLVTQYSRGETLQKRIQDQGPLELKEILRIGMQTARGLAAAHAQGLVHRDVKPSNILLDGTVERALLTDFGLARAVDDASITRTGIIAGTPQYMSPEQARGGSVDARSDLFGLGCVLYAMCTGRPPFRADNSYAILRMITDDEPRPIREVNPDLPDWLGVLILRLMSKSPDARFGNALEVAALLEQCLAHVQQPTSVSLPESLVRHAVGRRSIFNVARKGVPAMFGTIGMVLLGILLSQSAFLPADPQGVQRNWNIPAVHIKNLMDEYQADENHPSTKAAAPSVDQGAQSHATAPQPPGTPQEILQRLVRGGKIDTKSLNAMVSAVARHAAQDPEFARRVLDEFNKSCAGGDKTMRSRRDLLNVLVELFGAWDDHPSRPQAEPFSPHDVPPVRMSNKESIKAELLASVIEHAYNASNSEIATFTLVARQRHGPDAREFLRDVLRNSEQMSDPLAPRAPGSGRKKTLALWKEPSGAQWPEARFVAAVGLAELGEAEAIEWLLAQASPNDFGIDTSLWQYPHLGDSRGSLRESSRLSLIDLFRTESRTDAAQLAEWWKSRSSNSKSKFGGGRVRIKLGMQSPAATPPSVEQIQKPVPQGAPAGPKPSDDRVQHLDGSGEIAMRKSVLTIKVDLPKRSEKSEKEMIHIRSFGEDREIGESSAGRLTWTDVASSGTLIVENLAAGEYEVSRIRRVPLFKFGEQGEFFNMPYRLDATRVRLDVNDRQSVTLSHPQGVRLSGRVLKFRESGLDVVGIHVCESDATGAIQLRTQNWKCYDVATTDDDGHFQTEPISPGRYKVIAAGFQRKNRERITPSDIDFPRYLTEQDVVIEAAEPPKPLELTLVAVQEDGPGEASAGLVTNKPMLKDMLNTKIAFESDASSLEFVLSALATKVKLKHPNFKIKIMGNDLKLEGVTRNQRIQALKLEEKTVGQVLTAVVASANPNALAKDPRDPRFTLIWVIGADPDEPGTQAILITTRDGAAKRKDKLPEDFEKK